MRLTRALAAAAALIAAMPRIGTAQLGSTFTNAWFWGAKMGAMDYNSLTSTHRQAPLAGVEWLITRTHGGLYVSYSEAFFTDVALLNTNLDATDTIPHIVNLKNLRRLDLAAMVFPGSNTYLQPYAGIWFSLKQISSATPGDSAYASADVYNAVQSYITELRTGVSPYFIAGAQLRLIGFSIFIQ